MTRAALAICVVLAWALARRAPHPRQRVIAAALTGLLAIDVVRMRLAPGSDIDVAAFALWYAVGALAVWSALGPLGRVPCPDGSGEKDATQRAEPGKVDRRNEPDDKASEHVDPNALMRHAWIMLTACAIASPIAYRHGVDVGRAAFALSLAAQLLAAVRFLSRGRVPDDAQRVALILAASSLADIAGPWLLGEPARDWFVGRWPAVITWTVVAGWEIRCLTRARR